MEQMMNVEKIRAFMAKQQPKAHPIEGHPLADMEDYVRRQYVDMLCVFAQYENKGAETASNFIARLMAGAGMSEPVTDHIKNAMELTVEKFEEFLRLCGENSFQELFLLDAILVSCAGGVPERKQLELLAEVAETLRLDKERVRWLSRLADVILQQSKEAYDTLCRKMTAQYPIDVYMKLILPACQYLTDFISGPLIDTEDILWIYSSTRKRVDLSGYFSDSYEDGIVGIIKKKTVILENLILHTQEITLCEFEKAQTVKMKNCSLNNWRFSFPAAEYVELNGCEYTMSRSTDVSINHFLNISSKCIRSIFIEGCHFHDIHLTGMRAIALICTYSPCEFTIRQSLFKDIFNSSLHGVIILFAADTVRLNLDNCHFTSCGKGYNNKLFYNCSIAGEQSCKFENCSGPQ